MIFSLSTVTCVVLACSRLPDSRVREIENALLYFRMPYTYASFLLSEILEQASGSASAWQAFERKGEGGYGRARSAKGAQGEGKGAFPPPLSLARDLAPKFPSR